jgi:hypothetical protein
MSTDYRALCAELADWIDNETLTGGHHPLVKRARTALAQPEPEGEIVPSNRPIISAPKLSIFAVNRPAIGPVSVAEGPAIAEEAYVAFVQICKGNSDDAGTYDADEELVRCALKKLSGLEHNAQPVPVPAPMSADTLAAIIREVDGNHDKGAAALAEAILSHPGSRWSPTIEPEGVGDVQIMELMPQQLQKDLATVSRLAGHGAGPDVGPGLFRVSLNTGIIEHCRAVLTHYTRPTTEPVPVAERPWEREKGWRDLDGECWWCPPDGPPYWQMANPAMVYGGWLLPPRALPLPTPTP